MGLHKLRVPLSKCLTKKTDCLPFENNASVEFLCQKNDASLFVMGNHTKKRPHNLVLAAPTMGTFWMCLSLESRTTKVSKLSRAWSSQWLARSHACISVGTNGRIVRHCRSPRIFSSIYSGVLRRNKLI